MADVQTTVAIVAGAATLGGGLATGLWHAAMHVGRLTLKQEDQSRRIDRHDERLDDHDDKLKLFSGVIR